MADFEFKEFWVRDDNCAMKVGTDSILLGSWVNVNLNPNAILDIGAGSGLLSLMCAQKFQCFKIFAVEIDESAFIDLEFNCSRGGNKQKFQLHNCDFNSFQSIEKFDLILSNPPYFSKSKLANSRQKNLARHSMGLNICDLADGVERYLDRNGLFYVIFPFDQYQDLIFEFGKKSIFANRICEIRSTVQSKIVRVMICFSKIFPTEIQKENLIIRNEFGYTDEFEKLTSDFYLEKVYRR